MKSGSNQIISTNEPIPVLLLSPALPRHFGNGFCTALLTGQLPLNPLLLILVDLGDRQKWPRTLALARPRLNRSVVKFVYLVFVLRIEWTEVIKRRESNLP